MSATLREWLTRVAETGVPITFRTRQAGALFQGWVGEMVGDTLVCFENGPMGGPCDVHMTDIDLGSLACWVGGDDGWQDWTEPLTGLFNSTGRDGAFAAPGV